MLYRTVTWFIGAGTAFIHSPLGHHVSRDRLMSDEFLGTIIRKGKWGRRINTALNVGAMAAAPFTGGLSLGANAARIAAQKGLLNMAKKRQLGKLAGAQERVGVAQQKLADTAVPIREKNQKTWHAARQDAKMNRLEAVGRDPNQGSLFPTEGERLLQDATVNQNKPASFENLAQRGNEGKPINATSNYDITSPAWDEQQTAQRGVEAAQGKADAIQQNVDDLTQSWKEIQDSKLGENANLAGMVGVQSWQSHQRNKQIDAQRQAEDEKRARENAGTGGAKSTTTA